MTVSLAPVRLDEILGLGRSLGASDVHLQAERAPVFRIDGALDPQPTVAVSAGEIERVAGSLLDERAMRQFHDCGDVTVVHRTTDGSVRAHIYRAQGHCAIAFRLLPAVPPPLETLRLPAAVDALATRSHGLVLFTGPTGSGKSTALAGVLDRINRTQTRNIITIEDPVEFSHAPLSSMISQREIGRDVAGFAEAIYGALRCDPDVLLIGELRHPQAIQAALTAAETGHLVFATLHTGDSAQTIDRIVGCFDGALQEQIRISLAQTLLAAVCLRLVPMLAGRGRRPAVEMLVANDAVRNLIRERKTHLIRNVLATSRQSGMQTLEAHLSDLISRREISFEAACSATERASELRGGRGLG